jgi:hypothetical protein
MLAHAWWCMPGITALRKQRLNELEFKASLCYSDTLPQKKKKVCVCGDRGLDMVV